MSEDSSNQDDSREDAQAREISMFAALARGDLTLPTTGSFDSYSQTTSTNDDNPLPQHDEASTMRTAESVAPPQLSAEDRRERRQRSRNRNSNMLPSDLASLDEARATTDFGASNFGGGGSTDFGTFRYTQSANATSSSSASTAPAAEQANLEAAAQALRNMDEQQLKSESTSATKENENQSQQPSIETTPDAPMCIEQVVLERPLFFGPILSPRLIDEGRRLIAPHAHRPVSEMPPGVRNFIGAVRTFGFGLDKLLFLDEDEFEQYCLENPEYWRGDATISLYSPLTDEATRAQRMEEVRKRSHRPKHVQRSSIVRSLTAPSRLGQRGRENDSQTMSLADDIDSFWQQPSDEGRQQPLDARSISAPASIDATVDSTAAANDAFGSWLRAESDRDDGGGASPTRSTVEEALSQQSVEPEQVTEEPPKVLTETELFAKWANASGMGTISLGTTPRGNDVTTDGYNTFQKVSGGRDRTVDDDDDNDSVVDDELKKQVGLNEHLSKAIASLTDDAGLAPVDDFTEEESKGLFSRDRKMAPNKRPLSNYELTKGCVPMFGVDDDPLPVESDLGVHETREEQQRSNDLKRSQDYIEKFVEPNIFGCVACPSPALGPDDFHSWKSRTAPSQFHVSGPSSNQQTISARSQLSEQSSTESQSATHDNQLKQKAPHKSEWKDRMGWWNVEHPDKTAGNAEVTTGIKAITDEFPSLHLPPLCHASTSMRVSTLLEPTAQSLRERNSPLANLHAATPMAECLPYISDRPPSYRYLQVDTQAVGFPLIGAEIEPLFCSVAIYNVEAVSDHGTTDKSPTPMPDLQRCGRVTEALHFDMVSDDDVLKRCRAALWPDSPPEAMTDNALECCRCGVFPIPSNLSVSHLYVVLVVKKVFSGDDGLDPYLKQLHSTQDVERDRRKAETAANLYGRFLTPFAFGVAPLHQVFGAEDPAVATSRAVQIPLFAFRGGEKTIIDHVMAMLYSRADPVLNRAQGSASVTNGGSAMLIMRNFGYLGLHLVVDKKSSLARDRLIDVTGEVQMRMKSVAETDADSFRSGNKREDLGSQGIWKSVAPSWRSTFVAEPADHGRRSVSREMNADHLSHRGVYAKELAVVPLQLTPPSRLSLPPARPGVLRSQLLRHDLEAVCFTTFCNELLFHPRLVHNSFSKNVIVKAELREMQYGNKSHFAHLPACGPRIFNNRRGQFLVQEIFTSCSTEDSDHQFLDEFKLKLPLDLHPVADDGSSRHFALLFTVFNILMNNEDSGTVDERVEGCTTSSLIGFENANVLEQIACGYLPLSSGSTLLDDGLHDVRMSFMARGHPSRSHDDMHGLILMERDAVDASDFDGEPISLSVRTVAHSTLHSQNKTISSLLQLESRNSESPPASTKTIALEEQPAEAKDEGLLCELCMELTKPSVCAIPQSSKHFGRLNRVLWRIFISGSGKEDLAWSNPVTSMELRVQAFASLMRLLGSTTMYLSKSGRSRIDGASGWSIVTLSRLAALEFDEELLFGRGAVEAVVPDMWLTKLRSQTLSESSSPASEKRRRRGHVRQTYDISNEVRPRRRDVSASVDFSSLSGSIFSSDVPGFESGQRSAARNQDDQSLNVGMAAEKPNLIQRSKTSEGNSSDNAKPLAPLHVDSKSDFQSHLRAAMLMDQDVDGFDDVAARSLVHVFGGASVSGNRRWMTMPTRSLATIREVDAAADEGTASDELLEATDVLLGTKGRSATQLLKPSAVQMRVPSLSKKDKVLASPNSPDLRNETAMKSSSLSALSVPLTDQDIESAGSAFLDTISQSLKDNSGDRTSIFAGEERRVGFTNHRSGRSHGTSIDWSIASASRSESDRGSQNFDAKDTAGLLMLREEETGILRLPNFKERISIDEANTRTSRWWPYAYEVIICQWCAILITQRVSAEKPAKGKDTKLDGTERAPSRGNDPLARAAERCSGVSIASAPMLFEVIKQSLGFRIMSLYRGAYSSVASDRYHPPLIMLDDSILLNLEHTISMVADACLDARNFDSWELRQMSIDVNDSIIRFLCDLFSYIAPNAVHRLILLYFSRFVTRDGKQWHESDSLIGLRPSWEITKLRLNAITALVRFPDSIRVSGPQTENWRSKWIPCATNVKLFDAILNQYDDYRLLDLVGGDEISRKSLIVVPSTRKPHWLSELTVDVCLVGIGHAEQQIQQRSSSLLYEFFWKASQHAFQSGECAAVGAMFLTLIEKLLPCLQYLSSFNALNQLRADVVPCAIFVLQSAPAGLLRALWRRLCGHLPGKGRTEVYGFSCDVPTDPQRHQTGENECSILDLFKLLNLSLKTVEYSGCEENLETDLLENCEITECWKRDFLLSYSYENHNESQKKRKMPPDSSSCNTTISRRWMSHDAAIVIIDTAHAVVLEMYNILCSSHEGRSFLNPAVRNQHPFSEEMDTYAAVLGVNPKLSHLDILTFVRGVTSVYLQALVLNESDIAIVKTFRAAAETIKIFGIRVFLEALGETLQHWMRVLYFLCGARRAQVRVEATDVLELILRSSWECYGSFFRIRVPLLAVQTEVMERIVAIAAARFYKEERRRQATFYGTFSNLHAEASLVPLWRTLDRIEKQPASQNIAFRGALVRIAGKLKRLYRAYIAARVLSFMQSARQDAQGVEPPRDRLAESSMRAQRISVLRVINASENYSKQFLGLQGTYQSIHNLAHYEAVEDAMVNAADVFSPTELPEHRVAWLRMLADFHATRRKFAEEATCHFQIHTTLRHAARLHGSLWSNSPFLPWTDNMPDPVYIDGDRELANTDAESELDYDSNETSFVRQTENASSFRRIFYRVANSIATGIGEWETGAGRNLFYGTSCASEYNTVLPWLTLREMEENMVEEAEAAGELYLQAGIIPSSRYSWNIATQYYAERYNYTKLALTYSNLAATVVTSVPPIDKNIPQEISAALGRFYRVWFHGGAPDELSGVEFIYRTEANIRLDNFGDHLKSMIKSIIPDKTPIHLLLDDRIEEKVDESNSTPFGYGRIGAAPLEPVRIKVTPLRPLTEAFGTGMRGRPEWFRRYCEDFVSGRSHRMKSDVLSTTVRPNLRRNASNTDNSDPQHRDHARSFSATGFSSGNHAQGMSQTRHRLLDVGDSSDSVARPSGELAGVDKFCFIQPKERKSSKDWWRTSSGDAAEKSLKVTQLQVAQAFPACVTRQVVVHRLVYSQSPLEAGIDAICQWCAVLFRTAIATSGQAILQQNGEPGIGADAAKVVADCIHASNVKAIGIALLNGNYEISDGEGSNEFSHEYDRLSDEEISKLRQTVSRLIVVFIELLHLLIVRNRDQLLDVIQTRKRGDADSQYPAASLNGKSSGRSVSNGRMSQDQRKETREQSPASEHSRHLSRVTTGSFEGRSAQYSFPSTTPDPKARIRGTSDMSSVTRGDLHKRGRSGGDTSTVYKTDSAIALQSELQRAFIAFCKILHPRISGVLEDETPRWLRNCIQDNYFSLGTYRHTKVPIADELCFNSNDRTDAGFVLGPPENVETVSSHGSMAGSSNSVLSRGSFTREANPFGAF
ncbi:hypothetical protein MPSEU_000132600 [Mayamaea pseudoterrestris]|nr:hypothetical protein MPSEU_000132600 [Mayamaea pseudoterrestris]